MKSIARSSIDVEADGTITRGNASSLNDGAAALVLISERRARDLGVQGLARVAAFADQAVEPLEVAKAPSLAISGSERWTAQWITLKRSNKLLKAFINYIYKKG